MGVPGVGRSVQQPAHGVQRTQGAQGAAKKQLPLKAVGAGTKDTFEAGPAKKHHAAASGSQAPGTKLPGSTNPNPLGNPPTTATFPNPSKGSPGFLEKAG